MPRPLVFGALVFGELKLCLFQGTGVQKPRTSFFFFAPISESPMFSDIRQLADLAVALLLPVFAGAFPS